MAAIQAATEADAGQIEAGIAAVDGFVAETQPVKQHWLDAELYRLRGELLLQRTPAFSEEAEATLQRGIAVARVQRTKTFELRAAVSLARLWRDQGKVQQARELLGPVYGWFTEGFDARDLKEAKALLEECTPNN
jgi:predicted ATPase